MNDYSLQVRKIAAVLAQIEFERPADNNYPDSVWHKAECIAQALNLPIKNGAPPDLERTRAAIAEHDRLLPELNQALKDADTEEARAEARDALLFARTDVCIAYFEDLRYTPHRLTERRAFTMTVDEVRADIARLTKVTLHHLENHL